jgi:hypothetical protein
MKSRLLVLFTLSVLFLPLLFQPAMATPKVSRSVTLSAEPKAASIADAPVVPDGSPQAPSPDYSRVGTPRQIQEVANRTDNGQFVSLLYNSTSGRPINGSANVVLASAWTGYKLGFSISQLYENRCWVLNPSFNGNANNWTSGYYNTGYANTFSQTWQSGGIDGNGFVRVQENGVLSGGFYYYDQSDRVWWRQTYTVNRSSLAWAGIRMDYRVNSAWATTAFFNVYIRVNGTQVWAAGFPSPGDTNWHNTGFVAINSSLFTIPSKAIQVEVGIISIWTGGYSSNNWVQGDFDNVQLYMKTQVYPSDIKLKMNGLTVQNGATRGLGSVTQVPTRVWTSSPVIALLNWTPVPRPPNPNLNIQVTGLCALNLFANKTASSLYALSPSAVGVKLTALNGQNTTWELYYLFNLPTQYWNDVFNITLPKDWNVTFVSEPQLPTVNKIGQCQGGHVGDGYLRVPSTTITVTPDGYWTIRATSHNYAYSAELQVWQGSWSTTTAIRAGNTTRVRAQILDGFGNPPSGVASTQANVSIYQPGGSLWYTRLVTPTAQGWVYTSNFVNAGWNTTGGTYLIYVSWDNSTEAGEKTVSYTMQHSTGLLAREPTIETYFENKTLYPRVRYTDVDNYNWLEPPASVVGNWTTGTIGFYYVAGTGYWQAEINVLDAHDVGQFRIRVNATKASFDGAQCWILIDITSETNIASPQSGGVYIPWRDNATIQIHYTRKDGVGITGCIPYIQVTANWTAGRYTIGEVGSGWYNIRINSTGPGFLGSFRLNVTISKERYQLQQFYVTVNVRNILTDLRYTTPTNVYWGQNTSIPLFFNDTDHGGIAIRGATVTCNWPGAYYVSGTYMLKLRTDTASVGLHTVNITVSKTCYETRIIVVQFYVNPLAVTVSATVADPITCTYGEYFWVEVYVRTIFSNPLTDARVTFSWTGGSFTNTSGPGGLYGHRFLSSTGTVGIHYITIFVNRTNCAQTYFSIVLNVKQIPSFLDTVPPRQYQLIYVVGESFCVPVNYTTTLHGPVTNASVTFVVGSLSGTYTEVGGGIYNVTINTAGLVAGSYTIYVTASSNNTDSQSRAISLILTLRPAAIEPETPVINIYWGNNFTVLVYFHNLFNDTPIGGANIAYFWGTYTGSLQPNGTIGWYRVTLPTSIFAAGTVYQVTLTANYPSFQFALATVTINIQPQRTTLRLLQAESRYDQAGIITPLNLTGWTVPRGDVLWLYFNFTDSLNKTVTGATAVYHWAQGSGVLEYQGGLYIAKINLTDVSPSLYSLTITLSRQNFETAQLTQLPLNVIRIPTAITIMLPTDLASQDSMQLYTGVVFDFKIVLNDTFHRLVIKTAHVTLSIPALSVEDSDLVNGLDGTYTYPRLSIAFEGTIQIEIHADAGILYAVAQRTVTLIVTLNPLVVRGLQIGAIAAIVGIILLGGWVAYTKVFSIPWLVRKMRGMSGTLGKGKTPRLSKGDMKRIATRPDQMAGIVEPAYEGIGVAMPAAVVPVAVSVQEREAEDETIWHELDGLEGLGRDQKLELFEEMKRIPPKDRVWFLEDLKRQMVEGARFRRKPVRPAGETAAAAPIGPKEISPAMMRRLDAISALDPEEKQAVIRQLKGLSRAEQEEVVRALEEAER